MTYLLSILTGVASSIVASIVFLFFISRFRPKIEISPYIAKHEDANGTSYVFKMINKTKRPIINVRCHASLVTHKVVPGGVALYNNSLNLISSERYMLDKYDKKDNDAKYAWRIATKDEIEDNWNEDQSSYIVLKVIATDSFTGFSKYFSQTFYIKRDSLKFGSHCYGDNLAVC